MNNGQPQRRHGGGAHRTYHQDRAATNAERGRKFKDKEYSIDDKMNEAIQKINFKRRAFAEKSLVNWVKTYGIPLLLNDEPPPLGLEVLEQMERTITAH